jgi:hypothetical protein
MFKRLTFSQLPWSGGFQNRHLTNQLRRHHNKKYLFFFKFLKYQNFENWKKFWAPFFEILLRLRGPFWNNFVGWGLTTFIHPDVSTTSPASFFTIMPKGLTTSPKSRMDYSWSNTHDPCGNVFSCRQNAKKRLWQEVIYTWADDHKTRQESHFQATKM